ALGMVAVPTGSAGLPTITSVFNQNGGTVKAATVVFGSNGATLGSNSPTFASTYNLAGGTLAAASVTAGSGTFNASSNRRINWSGGVITNFDADTDLAFTGRTGAGGAITLALSGSDTKTFAPEAGRQITVGANTVISGSGSLTVNGAGAVVLGGSASYSGATTVTNGSLLVDTVLPNTSGVTVASGGILGGSGTIAGAVSVLGAVSPGPAGGLGTLTIGALTLDNASATLLGISGTNPGADYDAINVTQASALTYGGDLTLAFANIFGDDTSFGLFGVNGTPSGSYASVMASGSYGPLTFTRADGVWTAAAGNGQTLAFTESTGMLSIIPEPTMVVSGVMTMGLVAVLGLRGRRRSS
ncbi:MAG: hypothetical protein ACR2IT_11610, partial [Pirellulales bacterium]